MSRHLEGQLSRGSKDESIDVFIIQWPLLEPIQQVLQQRQAKAQSLPFSSSRTDHHILTMQILQRLLLDASWL